jgi:hypothetical protein
MLESRHYDMVRSIGREIFELHHFLLGIEDDHLGPLDPWPNSLEPDTSPFTYCLTPLIPLRHKTPAAERLRIVHRLPTRPHAKPLLAGTTANSDISPPLFDCTTTNRCHPVPESHDSRLAPPPREKPHSFPVQSRWSGNCIAPSRIQYLGLSFSRKGRGCSSRSAVCGIDAEAYVDGDGGAWLPGLDSASVFSTCWRL